MNTIIDLNSEVLIDRLQIRNPHLRLLLTAFGQELAKESPWVAVNKEIASEDELLTELIDGQIQHAAA
jgi:hypothetical protein